MTNAVAEIVRQARLTADAGRRRHFTVAHAQAVLAMRARPAVPWAFTVPLLRAAVVLGRAAVASVKTTDNAITIAFVVPAARWDEIDLSGLLAASLQPDRGHDPLIPASVAAAWRRLVGRAVNGALGANVPWVELHTPIGGRRWERGVAAPDRDPYAEHLRNEPTAERTFELRVGQPEPSLVRRLWTSPERVVGEIARLWSIRLARDVGDLAAGVQLVVGSPIAAVDLAGFATWWPEPAAPQLVLERDGIGLALVTSPELADPRLRGRVDCPALTLDIDEKAVVIDDDFDRLVACLLEATAGASPVPSIDAFDHDGEVLYAWRHRIEAVPPSERARVLPVWPGELAKLRAEHRAVDFLSFAAFHRAGSRPPTDLAALEQGSLGAFSVETSPLELDDDHTVELRVRAYVHRYPTAELGAIELRAWRRTLVRVQDAARVVAGLTAIVDIAGDESTMAMFAPDGEAVAAAVEHVRAAIVAAESQLFEVVLARTGPGSACWSIPFLRRRLETLDAVALGLRFALDDGGALRLAWDHSPALAVHVATDRDDTRRTLRDALERARDVGGLVIAAEKERWYTLESDDPSLSAWKLDANGRSLLQRVLGSILLWQMPLVPEAQPRPVPVAEQPHIVLGREEVAQKLAALGTDDQASEHLLAHLLATRGTDADTHGLELVPLLRRFDPRALNPRSRISLANAIAEHTLVVAPFAAGDRRLDAPVLEVSPSIAALLHETLAATPAETARERADARPMFPEAPRARRVDPTAMLVRVPIADRLCAGALHLAEEPSPGIELWAKGLRVGAFRLPSPLRDCGGRLWLTDAGIGAGHAGLVKVALTAGRELVQQAVGALGLSPPRSPRREVLAAFLANVRDHLRRHKDFMRLGEVVGLADDRDVTQSVAPLRALPPPRDRLPALLRWALARPLQVDTAWLSWRAARVLDAGMPGRIELGSRHDIVGPALDDRAPIEQLWPAAIVVVAATLAAAPSLGNADIALARILASARRG